MSSLMGCLLGAGQRVERDCGGCNSGSQPTRGGLECQVTSRVR
jgi:hypothetical protein